MFFPAPVKTSGGNRVRVHTGDGAIRVNGRNRCRTRAFQITYEAVGPVQMNFLRLLSQNAYQNFTYTCINSAAWYNAKADSYDMAVKFMGENSVQFSSDPSSPKVDVTVDGCKVRRSSLTFTGH